MSSCSCIHCRRQISAKGIFVHVDRMHLGSTKYSTGNNGRYVELTRRAIERHEALAVRCPCGVSLTREQRLAKNAYCSTSCAARHNNAVRREHGWKMPLSQREAVSAALKGRNRTPGTTVICARCGTSFIYRGSLPTKRRFCGRDCWKATVSAASAAAYRQACQFKFDVADYPDEFDLELVRQHGWYSPSNRAANLRGVSRDHLFSVADGRSRGVSAKVMSHPANCQLMLHQENKAKAHVSTITFEQLLERIAIWERKYVSSSIVNAKRSEQFGSQVRASPRSPLDASVAGRTPGLSSLGTTGSSPVGISNVHAHVAQLAGGNWLRTSAV
jgi:hypothetical protein